MKSGFAFSPTTWKTRYEFGLINLSNETWKSSNNLTNFENCPAVYNKPKTTNDDVSPENFTIAPGKL